VIVVVGSVNLDTVATVEDHPRPGETVLASSHLTSHGGKGANQAVAAARLGADVRFIGAVGDDGAGVSLADELRREGIDTDLVQAVRGPSGVALVTVDRRGENTIVVGRGANAHVRIDADERAALADADVVLCQLEIPMTAVTAAAEASRGVFILNAAPARPVPSTTLGLVDVLVVNQHELVTLAGSPEPSAARSLGVPTVVVTLGARGAQIITGSDVGFVPAPVVEARDTTGAGDTFCGALAASLDEGLDVFEATARGVVAGSLATTGIGARTAMPGRDRLLRALEIQR
jgi:ribokinase